MSSQRRTHRSWASSLPTEETSREIVGRNPPTRETAYDVDVTQLVQPEVVRRVGRAHEVTISELLVDLLSGKVEFVKDPLLNEALVARGLHPTRSVCAGNVGYKNKPSVRAPE